MEQPAKVALSPEKQLVKTKGIAWYLLSRYGADSDNSEGMLPPATIDNIINHEKQSIIDQIEQLSDYISIPCALNGHDNTITSVAYSPDGTQLASGSWDTTIKLWNPLTRKCTYTLKGHKYWLSSVAYSPDGNQLVSGSWCNTRKASWDGTIKLWNTNTRECTHTSKGYGNYVNSLTYNHNSTQLTNESYDTTIKLWDLTAFNRPDLLTLEQATSLLQYLQTIKNNGLE